MRDYFFDFDLAFDSTLVTRVFYFQFKGKVSVKTDTLKAALKGLYVITDSQLMPEADFFNMVRQALEGGASIVQFRDKGRHDRQMLEKAIALRRLCEKYHALFIVNDHVGLAVEAGAHGLHVGEDDSDLQNARKAMQGGIVGVSCYNDLERAVRMAADGADYVAFGSFFPSPTKPGARRAEPELLAAARTVLDVPVCAIGGITAENAEKLVLAGAHMTAVISDIWRADNIRERCSMYVDIFRSVREKQS